MSRVEEFKKELKELLTKYDATLGVTLGFGSDTHGIYDEEVVVSFSSERPHKDHFISHGMYVCKSDI